MTGRLALGLAAILLLAFLLSPESFAPLLRPLTRNGAPPVYTQTSLLSLTLSHLGMVAGAVLVAERGAAGWRIEDADEPSRSAVHVGLADEDLRPPW